MSIRFSYQNADGQPFYVHLPLAPAFVHSLLAHELSWVSSTFVDVAFVKIMNNLISNDCFLYSQSHLNGKSNDNVSFQLAVLKIILRSPREGLQGNTLECQPSLQGPMGCKVGAQHGSGIATKSWCWLWSLRGLLSIAPID